MSDEGRGGERTRGGAPFWLPAGAAASIALLDQATKWTVSRGLGPGEAEHRVEVFGSALALHYVQNTGAAFGLLRGQTVLLTAVALVVVAGLIVSYLRARAPSMPLALGLGLLVGGATGNLIDRYRLGFVVDFVSVGNWPKFNLADAAITAGVVLLGIHLWRMDSVRHERSDHASEGERRPAIVDAER